MSLPDGTPFLPDVPDEVGMAAHFAPRPGLWRGLPANGE